MEITEKITLIKNIIRNNGNNFITVDFIKKSTGELRHMMCHRSKVLEASVTGNNPEATAARRETNKVRNNIVVEEIVKPGTSEYQWRTIPMENVKTIKANGMVWEF